MPSEVDGAPSMFDRFANVVAGFVSKAWVFLACVGLVLVWAPTFFLFQLDTWQLIINTATTIITFLLVALLQNTEKRADAAVQKKLNAIALGIGDLLEVLGHDVRADELYEAVGLEKQEST